LKDYDRPRLDGLREDEDVAGMGINHVATKLLRLPLAPLLGLAGTIFAAKLTSVYPHSMNFLVSINVLSLIIIGGMGIPGVLVARGADRAPRLLREFASTATWPTALLVAGAEPRRLWPESGADWNCTKQKKKRLNPSPKPKPCPPDNRRQTHGPFGIQKCDQTLWRVGSLERRQPGSQGTRHPKHHRT
jgi:hypothetical protein